MTEEEYIKATNLTKIRMMKVIFRDVMSGDEYAIDCSNFAKLEQLLVKMEVKLNDSFELKG